MFVADQPVQTAPSESDRQDVIEVVGTRPGQVQRIDRRIYRVRQTPHSAQASSIDLLRGLPAVTITPDDRIRLLGSSGVTILVDERPVNGDPLLFLRTLRGSQIERIEIITNPSAQYSSQGSGGIINFVLRREQAPGLSGSGSLELASRGRAESSGTIKRKSGRWTSELQAQGNSGRTGRSTYRKLRSVQAVAGGPSTINREDGGGSSDGSTGFLSGKLTYEPSSRTSASAGLFGGVSDNRSRNTAEFTAVTPDFVPFNERQRYETEIAFGGAELSFDHKGRREGETLKASARLFGNPGLKQETSADLGQGRSYLSDRNESLLFGSANADWVRPLRKDRILSVGASWDLRRTDRRYRFRSSDGERFGPDVDDRFDAVQNVLAAYATFQQPVGTWTFMPGLRMERLARTISSPGRPSARVTRTSLSPTLHVEHPLSKTLNMTLSYSKRIDRPDLDQLRPYPLVTGALTIEQGNPRLRDQTTDAYELKLHYRRKSLTAGVILYDRETSGLWSSSYFVNEQGLNVFTQVNAGRKSDRGAQFDVTAAVVKRVKGMVSVNLFSNRVPIDPAFGDEHSSTFRYTANATADWQGRERGRTPGDTAQLQFVYESPSREFQFRRTRYYSLNLAYTRSFSRSLSITANLNGVGPVHFRHQLLAPTVQEGYDRRDSLPEFKVKLVKTLGEE
jgi:outer membrane receptor for ferrienterochelin and colicin